jgi:hypothetical protein
MEASTDRTREKTRCGDREWMAVAQDRVPSG